MVRNEIHPIIVIRLLDHGHVTEMRSGIYRLNLLASQKVISSNVEGGGVTFKMNNKFRLLKYPPEN